MPLSTMTGVKDYYDSLSPTEQTTFSKLSISKQDQKVTRATQKKLEEVKSSYHLSSPRPSRLRGESDAATKKLYQGLPPVEKKETKFTFVSQNSEESLENLLEGPATDSSSGSEIEDLFSDKNTSFGFAVHFPELLK